MSTPCHWGGITHEHTISIRGMLRVRVRWTDTNINFGKLALWRYLSLIQLDNQRQHSTLYMYYILMATLAQSQSLSICNRSFLWVCNCNRFSCLFWPSNFARASFDFKTFTRCIAGFLVFLRPHDLRHTAANVAGDCRRSTLDCGLPTADCRHRFLRRRRRWLALHWEMLRGIFMHFA